MATLFVTFGRHDGRTEQLADAKNYPLTISGNEVSMTVPAGCNYVTLLPDANCWVAGGNIANAENGVERRPLVANALRTFSCRPGELISVVSR